MKKLALLMSLAFSASADLVLDQEQAVVATYAPITIGGTRGDLVGRVSRPASVDG